MTRTPRVFCGIVFGVLIAGPFVQSSSADGKVLKTAVKLKVPRKKKPRQGGPLDKVELAMWLPEDVKTLRGAVVNPFYLKAVGQKHWQAAARHWGFGIVAANYFGVKHQEFATTLQAALNDFARQSGRTEIANLPLCFIGMSAGGGMSVRFAEQMPKRTIAAAPVCLEVGPRSDASRRIPMVTIFGERDGRQMEKLLAKLPVERKQQACWAIAVQWGRRHEFARANNLAMVWFDHAIRMRYPEEATPKNGPVELQPIDKSADWIGDVTMWGENPAPIISGRSRKKLALKTCWFPDQYTAAVWQAFVIRKPRLRIVAPAGMGDGQPFQAYPAGKPLRVTWKLKRSPVPQRIELFDGHKKIAETTQVDKPLEIPGLKPGIHALIAVAVAGDGKRRLSPPNTIIVEEAK